MRRSLQILGLMTSLGAMAPEASADADVSRTAESVPEVRPVRTGVLVGAGTLGGALAIGTTAALVSAAPVPFMCSDDSFMCFAGLLIVYGGMGGTAVGMPAGAAWSARRLDQRGWPAARNALVMEGLGVTALILGARHSSPALGYTGAAILGVGAPVAAGVAAGRQVAGKQTTVWKLSPMVTPDQVGLTLNAQR